MSERDVAANAVARVKRPAILAEVPLDAHAVLEASAGTGKTFTLECLVVEILLSARATIDQILVVTFTERATAELRQRVRQRIEALLAVPPGHDEDPALADDACWRIDEDARARLRAALRAFDAATIATIHAFCKRVLAEHAFTHGRLLVESQVDGREAFHRAFRSALREQLARDEGDRRYLAAALGRPARDGDPLDELEEDLYKLSVERGALVPGFDEAALVRALAAVPPLPSEMRLASELKLVGVSGRSEGKVHRTLVAVAELVEAYRASGDAAAFLAGVDGIDGGMVDGRERSALGYLAGHLESAPGLARSLLAPLVPALAALESATPPFAAALAQRFLPPLRERLARRKREAGEFDFDDMLLLLRDGLRGPRGVEACRLLRERYRYALIDEFQDTDEVQWEIFRRAFHEAAPGENGENGENGESDAATPRPVLYVIGDPKQSIYGFRGADVHTYVAAADAIAPAAATGSEAAARPPGAPRRLYLADNWRSSPHLLDGVNAILDQRAAAPFFSGPRIRYDHPVGCGDRARGAVDERGREAVPIHLFAVATRARLDDVLAGLAGRIAAEVRRLLDARAPLLTPRRGETRRRLEAKDIHVLTRSEWEGRLVGDALRAAGVAHAYYKQDGLFDRPEATHVLDLLAAIDDPGSSRKRLRAWLTPFFGLSLADARSVARGDLLDADHPLARRLADWSALAALGRHDQLFARILEESGVVRRQLFARQGGERALTNYQHLFEILVEEAARTRASLGELVLALDGFVRKTRRPLGGEGEEPGLMRLESERDAVQIMTMHKSKGLEAEVVFLFGGLKRSGGRSVVQAFHDGNGSGARGGDEAGARPTRRAWVGRRRAPEAIADAIARESREEDERLLYVALTRARSRLYLPFFPTVKREPAERAKAAKGAKPAKKKSAAKSDFAPDGAYACVNERLRALVDEGAAPASLFTVEPLPIGEADAAPSAPNEPNEPAPSPRPVLRIVRDGEPALPLPEEAAPPSAPPRAVEAFAPLATWRPPTALLDDPNRGPALRALVAGRRGVRVTSYTRLRQDAAGRVALRSDGRAPREEAAEDTMIEPAGASSASATGLSGASGAERDGALPGGVAAGLYLHAVLERLELSALVDEAGRTRTVEALRARPDVAALLVGEARAHGLSSQHAAEAARLVHAALTAPVALPTPAGTRALDGLHRADARLREMEFLYPLAPHVARAVAAEGPPRRSEAPLTVAREGAGALVKGYVDYLFEVDGRAYFADWKSDTLPRWDDATVAGHVERHYLLQARLYSLALVRLLGVHDEAAYDARFGGLLYCFLRGMRPAGGAGVYARRPSWRELLAWESDLGALGRSLDGEGR